MEDFNEFAGEAASAPTTTIPTVQSKEKSPDSPPKEKRTLAPIPTDERGLLVGSTFQEQYAIARAYCVSGLMPAALNTPEKVMVAIQVCRELGLPPMTSVGKIMVVNGTPAIFGDLPLALVRRSGLLASINEEWLRDNKCEVGGTPAVLGARCTVLRKGDISPIVRQFTADDARRAGLMKKDIWTKYPERMLQMRARGWALKDAFPDVLGGVAIMEYDDFEDKPAKPTIADEIEREYGAAQAQAPEGQEDAR